MHVTDSSEALALLFAYSWKIWFIHLHKTAKLC